MDRPQLTSALDPPRAVYGSIAGDPAIASKTARRGSISCVMRTFIGGVLSLLWYWSSGKRKAHYF